MGLQLAGAPGGRKRAHGVDPSHRVGARAQVSFVPCGMVWNSRLPRSQCVAKGRVGNASCCRIAELRGRSSCAMRGVAATHGRCSWACWAPQRCLAVSVSLMRRCCSTQDWVY